MQSKNRKNKPRIVFFSGALFVLAFFSAFPFAFHFFSSAFNDTGIPLWNIGAAGGSSFSNYSSFLNSQSSLIAKNNELSEKVKNLEAEVNGYDFVVQENLELKKELFQKKENTIFAAVIARPNITAYDTFLIDVGESAGIKKGDKILANENMILGTVDEAYSGSSKALLFSTAGEISNALLGPDNIPVQLKGLGGGSFITELPRDMDVQKGDSAVLPGTPGYIVAQVVSKEMKSTDSSQTIYLRGPVNIFDAEYVQVVKDENL